MLLEEKIGLGINLGVSEGELLLPWEIIEWFVNVLDEAPNLVQTTPKNFFAPKRFPRFYLRHCKKNLCLRLGYLMKFGFVRPNIMRMKLSSHLLNGSSKFRTASNSKINQRGSFFYRY